MFLGGQTTISTLTGAEISYFHMYFRMLKISDDNIQCTYSTGGGLYPPPQIPCGVHVESRSIPGVHVDFRHFFLVVAQPIFCPESMWTPCGVQLDSSCSIWTTWTPPQNTGNMNSPSKTPYGVHMDSLHLLVLCYLLYKIKKCMGKD